MDRSLIALIALLVHASSQAHAQEASDPGQIPEAYFYVASKEATPYRQVATLDHLSDAGEWRPLASPALREFQRGGGIVIPLEEWTACLDKFRRDERCHLFESLILVVTEPPRLEERTLRLGFSRYLIQGPGECRIRNLSKEDGEFVFRYSEGVYFTDVSTSTVSDAFDLEDLKKTRECASEP